LGPLVSEPQRDDRDVDALGQQVHRRGVSQGMKSDVLVGDARAACCRCGEVNHEPVFQGVAGKVITARPAEQGVAGAGRPLGEVGADSLTTGPAGAGVAVSLIAGPDRHITEHALNSFLNCCLDISRIGRFLVLDTGLSASDRATLQQRYGFLEFTDSVPGDQPATQLAQLHIQIQGRFWLHLGESWRFFSPENYISRLTAILDAEPDVFQVGVNLTDAAALTGASAPEPSIRRTPDTGRYLLTDTMATGPAMFETTRLERAIRTHNSRSDPTAQRGRPSASTQLPTASLDEVLCITKTDC